MNRKVEIEITKPTSRVVCRPASVCGIAEPPPMKIRTGADTELHEKKSTEEAEAVLFSLARAVELRDLHTAGHCERLAVTGVALGVAMGLGSDQLLALYLGGYLHDIGKVGIPDSILLKTASLTADEWAIMRTHPACGEEICRPLQSLQPVLPIIRHHHERLDGTGYPDGLSGDAFPLLARIMQVADIYDALTNPRPYKQAYNRTRALEILEEEAARGWRDRDITRLFVRLHKRVHAKLAGHRPLAGPVQQGLANLREYLGQ